MSTPTLSAPSDDTQIAPQEHLWTRRARVLAPLALACLVLAVFSRMLWNDFVQLDVYDNVVNNPYIRGLTLENIQEILTRRCIYSYYPVRTLSYAADYQIWGLSPFGFELTNGLIHLANVLSVYWLILRLVPSSSPPTSAERGWWNIGVAAFGAAVFAVHPVVVEPVAWVCGREELLMTLGALGCLHFHITARQLKAAGGSPARAMACHVGAFLACMVACFSNAVGAVVPLLIVAYDLVTMPRSQWWKTLTATAAMLAVSLLTIGLKVKGDVDLANADLSMHSPRRLPLVLSVYWLNLKTLAWPVGLAPYYGRTRPPSYLDPEVLKGALAVGATGLILWTLRARKLVVLAVVWFLLALGPTAQVMPHHVARGDRFLYLPLVGLVAATAWGVQPLGTKIKPQAAIAVLVAAAALVVPLDWLSASQVEVWKSDLSLWEHSVKQLPDNARARVALADSLYGAGQEEADATRRADFYTRAVEQYETALKLEPDLTEAINNYALFLMYSDLDRFRNDDRALALVRHGYDVSQGQDAASRSNLCVAYELRAQSLLLAGQVGPAIYFYRRAIETDPRNDRVMVDLALILMNGKDRMLRDPQEALRLAEQACLLTGYQDADHLSVLAAAYAVLGRFPEAIAMLEKALPLVREANQPEIVADMERRLRVYHDRMQKRENSPGSASSPPVAGKQ